MKAGGKQWTAQRYMPEDSALHSHPCENLKSYTIKLVFNEILMDLNIFSYEVSVYHTYF
jgi:hypothetical protein